MERVKVKNAKSVESAKAYYLIGLTYDEVQALYALMMLPHDVGVDDNPLADVYFKIIKALKRLRPKTD